MVYILSGKINWTINHQLINGSGGITMGSGPKKTLSLLVVVLSSLGLLLSVFLLVQVWRIRQPLTDQLQNQLDQFSGTLHTTDEALVILDQLVGNVYTSTIYLNDTTTALSQTLENTNQVIDSASIFIGDNLISTITNTQVALESAQASAKVIDNILTAISRIPLIGIDYNPELPLNVALGDVSSSLDPLPEILTSFQKNLKTTTSNLTLFTGQISSLDQNIASISKNMEQAHVTISDYRNQLTSLISLADNAKNHLRTWVYATTWVLTVIILWILLSQLVSLFQNLSYLSETKPEQSHITEEKTNSPENM
jgi:ABC-type transporter Mla subunit MlaD